MRKIVLMMSMSLDGYIEGPDRDIGWHRVDDELHTHMNATVGSMGGLLHGRVVYELMADYWPTADADPDAPASVRSSPRSGGISPRSSTPGPSRRSTGTPPSSVRSYRKRSGL